MNLPTEVFGSIAVVHAPEELGADQASLLTAYLNGLVQATVVLDLDRCESIDSSGLTALLDSQDHLRGSNGDLKIATSNVMNRKILEITRLDQQLEVFDSVLDAVKSYRD
jgi:anti-sigma B factor antagonist